MDPTIGAILATIVTTVGLIAVAIINNRKERSQAAGAGVEAGLDDRNVLKQMMALISDIERKEKIIQDQDDEIADLKAQLAASEGDGMHDRSNA